MDAYLFSAAFSADYGDFADAPRSSSVYNRYVRCRCVRARALSHLDFCNCYPSDPYGGSIEDYPPGDRIVDRKISRVCLRTRKNKRFNAFPKPSVNAFLLVALSYDG